MKKRRKIEQKAREKEQETKLIEEQNKKLNQLAKKKDEGFTKKSRQRQFPQKHSQRASGEKCRQNLKKLMYNESTDSEYSEDFNDKCGVCKSKYPPLHESKACGSKVMGQWIQCDMCTEWFHLICLRENVDPEDNFVCENCC